MLEQTYGLDPASGAPARTKRVEPRRYRAVAQGVAPQSMPDTQPRLRLVGTPPDQPAYAVASQPIATASDPRWVLAVRTSEQLQGVILTPEARHRLMRLGKLLGLNAFDSSLVLAIVQDQARRGHPPDQCAAAARAQLQMVPLRGSESGFVQSLRRVNIWQLVGILGVAIVVELIVLKLIFGS